MKFEESKVINELYKSNVKKGDTGFVADDICTLKCVKLHLYARRFDDLEDNPYRFSKYKFILDKMKDYKHHLVKIEQLGRYKEDDDYYKVVSHEHLNLYFAKDKENKNYEQTYTKDFWKQLLKGDWW